MYVESRKNVSDEHICRAGIETKTQGTDVQKQWGGISWDIGMDVYALP